MAGGSEVDCAEFGLVVIPGVAETGVGVGTVGQVLLLHLENSITIIIIIIIISRTSVIDKDLRRASRGTVYPQS